MTADLDVVGARSSPPARSRAADWESIEQPAVPALLDRLELDAHLLDLLRALRGSLPESSSYPAPDASRARLRRRRRSARASVLRSPAAVGARLASSVGELLELASKSDAAILQAVANGLEVVSEKCGIEHGRPIRTCDTMARMERTIRKAVFPGGGSRHEIPPRDEGASRRRCWSWSTSRSSNTASRKPSQSGVNNIVIVTGRGKSAMEDHFDVAFELESSSSSEARRNSSTRFARSRARSGVVRAARRAARSGPRRARREESRRRRAVRRHSRRRCDRCESAGVEADD